MMRYLFGRRFNIVDLTGIAIATLALNDGSYFAAIGVWIAFEWEG